LTAQKTLAAAVEKRNNKNINRRSKNSHISFHHIGGSQISITLRVESDERAKKLVVEYFSLSLTHIRLQL
jgi:hypothetical protein